MLLTHRHRRMLKEQSHLHKNYFRVKREFVAMKYNVQRKNTILKVNKQMWFQMSVNRI